MNFAALIVISGIIHLLFRKHFQGIRENDTYGIEIIDLLSF